MKNIIYCADGTWNSSGGDDNDDGLPDPTNVYKMFVELLGKHDHDSLRLADEQESNYKSGGDEQVAKYIHGVGDSKNWLNKIIEGASGAGVVSRVVRGYTYISRNYEPGANIYIIGFSRGAYTARALAGFIAVKGLLSKDSVGNDKEKAYRLGSEAWFQYRNSMENQPPVRVKLAEIMANLPAFMSQGSLKNSDLIQIDNIKAVGVWDTVGAMGIPEYNSGATKTIDPFKFADTALNSKVQHGFHAIAGDEQRVIFTPTLWDQRDNVVQLIFKGAHADVGGGYPMKNGESSLSDISYVWMRERLKEAGVLFEEQDQYPIKPDINGKIHKPWEDGAWFLGGVCKRSFPDFIGKY